MERADLEQWKAREVARLLWLVETERRYYEEIASAIPVGLLVLSPDLTIKSANRAIRKIFGLSESPLRARLDALLPAGVLRRVTDVLKTGAPETNILVSDTKSRRLRIGIMAIHNWNDEFSPEALVSIEDLTGVETAGVLVPAGMAEASTERRFLQDQLVQSERVQALSKLAGRMAHDLNNILMIVTGHGEELLNGLPPSSTLHADVQEIMNATERMSGLTGHLLNFTRRPPAATQTIELEEFLRGVAQRLSVQFKPSSQPNLVKADIQRLEQILTSLVEQDRAVSIETASIEIKEELTQTGEALQPGSYGVIIITLTGRSFDAAVKSNWFEAVLPAKDTKDELPVAATRAYGIVRQWGGDIAVSAAPAGGTMLRIFLQSVSPTGVKTSAPVLVPSPGAEPNPITILVVDDETGIRELVRKILLRHGYHVLEASNGEEALAVWRENSGAIDLLITDVMMPRMGGPELVERLRKQGANPKVLYVSGYTDDPNIYAGKLPPGTAFLAKPFTLASLLDRVQEILRAGA